MEKLTPVHQNRWWTEFVKSLVTLPVTCWRWRLIGIYCLQWDYNSDHSIRLNNWRFWFTHCSNLAQAISRFPQAAATSDLHSNHLRFRLAIGILLFITSFVEMLSSVGMLLVLPSLARVDSVIYGTFPPLFDEFRRNDEYCCRGALGTAAQMKTSGK
jgi:hypothetical protein